MEGPKLLMTGGFCSLTRITAYNEFPYLLAEARPPEIASNQLKSASNAEMSRGGGVVASLENLEAERWRDVDCVVMVEDGARIAHASRILGREPGGNISGRWVPQKLSDGRGQRVDTGGLAEVGGEIR